MLTRFRWHQTVSLNTAVGTTEEIPFGNASGGLITVPNGSSVTTLTFHAAPYATGQETTAPTFEPLKDSANVAVTRTVAADGAYALPDECFGAGSLKIVSNASGDVIVSLKG